MIACDQGEVEHDEPDDPVRTAMRQMMGVFAQLERGMVVARLRRGRQAKKDASGYAQGRPPFGYAAFEGSLRQVPTEQAVIRKARRLRKAGQSYREIATLQDADGDSPRTGQQWHPTMISRLVGKDPRRA